MNLHYTYLLLDIASIIFPLAMSFDKKVAFYKSWIYLFPSILITSMFFIIWDIFFTIKGVWSFNPKYITGIYIFNLPIEELLFFICVPYSCIFIYESCNAYLQKDISKKYTTYISILLFGLSLLSSILYHNKTYTIVNATVCLFLILFSEFIYKFKKLGNFYLSYFISLIPFFICNGILTALPVVIYNNHENMNLRLYTIPLEDTFYCLSLLLSSVLMMDYFRNSNRYISKTKL